MDILLIVNLAFSVTWLLHLLGYDHMTEEDEKEMFGRQKEILEAFGLDDEKGKLIDSFGYAIVGIFFCLRHERNMKIHYLAAVVVICCGFYFHITKVEWMVLLIVIGIVMSLEMVNTAVEKQ